MTGRYLGPETIIVGLVASLVVCVSCVGFLAVSDRKIPDDLTKVIIGLIGALAGALYIPRPKPEPSNGPTAKPPTDSKDGMPSGR